MMRDFDTVETSINTCKTRVVTSATSISELRSEFQIPVSVTVSALSNRYMQNVSALFIKIEVSKIFLVNIIIMSGECEVRMFLL